MVVFTVPYCECPYLNYSSYATPLLEEMGTSRAQFIWIFCGGSTLTAHQMPIKPLSYSFSSAGQERKQSEKLTGQYKGHLINTSKDQMWKQEKILLNFFSVSHQQLISIHLLGSMVLVCAVVALEDKRLSNGWVPPLPSSFFLAFNAEQKYGMALAILDQLSWLCPLPASCLPQDYCAWESLVVGLSS